MKVKVKKNQPKGLIDIDMQSAVVYNVFGKAFEEFDADTADLIVTVFAFFGWILRWEKYAKAQDYTKVHHFLKHISIRWLTLSPAAARLIEQWPAPQRYFLQDILQNIEKIWKLNKETHGWNKKNCLRS